MPSLALLIILTTEKMKMKQTILSLALLLGIISSPLTQAQGKIATIDLQKVFDGYWKTKQISDNLQRRVRITRRTGKNSFSNTRPSTKNTVNCVKVLDEGAHLKLRARKAGKKPMQNWQQCVVWRKTSPITTTQHVLKFRKHKLV
jgi:Skp family chaperone for outer membrane proteins